MVSQLTCHERRATGWVLDEGEEKTFNFVADSLRFAAPRTTREVIDGGEDHFVKFFRLSPDATAGSSGRLGSAMRRMSITAAPQDDLQDVYDAEVLVDGDLQDCVAWVLQKSSRQRTQSGFDIDGSVARREQLMSDRRRETTEVHLD